MLASDGDKVGLSPRGAWAVLRRQGGYALSTITFVSTGVFS